jgi:hypothetical protein
MASNKSHGYTKRTRGYLLIMFAVFLCAGAAATSKTDHRTTKPAKLSWKDTSNNENGFRIYRITATGKVKIAEVGPNVTSYTDKTAPPRACYVVTAFNSQGESAPSKVSCG